MLPLTHKDPEVELFDGWGLMEADCSNPLAVGLRGGGLAEGRRLLLQQAALLPINLFTVVLGGDGEP